MANRHHDRCTSCSGAAAAAPAAVPEAASTSFDLESAPAGLTPPASPPSCGCGCSCNGQCEAEERCRQQMANCQSVCFVDGRSCPGGCTGRPVAIVPPPNPETMYERCCDPSGCCGLFPRCCRNPFWPSFAKPTWLCCRDLYKQ